MIVPCSSRMKVERMTPTTVLPYRLFSPYAPYAVRTRVDGSESSGKLSACASRNAASFAGVSGDIPTTS